MADFTFDRIESVQEEYERDVLTSRFENGSEQRRLASERKIVGYSLRSSALTKAQYQALRSFYESHSGPLDGFTWVEPFGEETITVRFDGKLQCEFRAGHRRATWKFERIEPAEA